MIYIISALMLATGVLLYPIGTGVQPINNGCNPCSQPQQGQWGQWGPWGGCQNNVYGVETKTRTRQCTTNFCPDGEAQETQQCVQRDPVPAPQWGNWGPWSACSRTCGGGMQTRTRTCNTQCGTCQCQGSNMEEEACNTAACPCTTCYQPAPAPAPICTTCNYPAPAPAPVPMPVPAPAPAPCTTCYNPAPAPSPCSTCGPQQPFYNPYSNGRKRSIPVELLMSRLTKNDSTISH